jgi:hypothetical protein
MNFSNFLILYIFSYISIFSSFSYCIKLSLVSNPSIPTSINSNYNLRSLSTQDLSTANDIYNILTTELCIGNPTQCFKLAYDTGNQYLIIGVTNTKAKFAKLFNTSLSETFKSTTNSFFSLPYRYGIIQAREVSDFLKLPNNLQAKYMLSFMISWNTTEKYEFDGILGLGNNYPKADEDNSFDERFSLVHNLYSNGVIDKKIFGHEYKTRKNGYLYLGEVPPSLGYDYFKCTVAPFIPYLNKWHCESRAIAVSNGANYTQYTSPYIFDTAYVDIRGPFYEGNTILSDIRDAIGEKCDFISEDIDEENRYVKLVCDYDVDIGKAPDVNFYLKGGYNLKLKNIDIFRVVLIEGKKKYLSKIIGDTRYNYWNLGEPILKNYDMVFNYEDNSIGFNENYNLKEGDWTMTIILMIIFIVIGTIGIYLVKNRKKIFGKMKNKDIEKFDKGEMLNSGEQMAEIFES